MSGIFHSLLAKLNRNKNTMNMTEKSHSPKTDLHTRRIKRESSTRERIQKEVGKEDYLLNQIDEFREKAQQLQDLLLTKENKVQELQTLVDEREGKADALQAILNERQEKADAITTEVEKQIDALILKVSAKMDEIESSMSACVEDGKEANAQQAKQVYDSLNQIQTQLQGMKDELADKVHTENVKCYRNIQDLFKGMDDKLDNVQIVGNRVKGLKGLMIFTMIMSIINFLGLVALGLYSVGIFDKLF